MSILIVTGLQGSGKSYFRNKWIQESPDTRRYVNYDELRFQMYGPDWRWNRVEEEKMKAEALSRAENHIALGRDVIIDNTNLTDGARRPWIGLGKKMGVGYELIDIDTPVTECVRRDAQREGRARVGRALIERNALFYGYIDWSDRSIYPRDFIIVDMDGTIADCTARRQFLNPSWTHKFDCTYKGEPRLTSRGEKCPQC